MPNQETFLPSQDVRIVVYSDSVSWGLTNMGEVRSFLWQVVATTAVMGVMLGGAGKVTWAQVQSDNSHPLESIQADPLLPANASDRALTPSEIRRLTLQLDELNTDARAEFSAGNVDQAFVIWYRELRLRRVLGKVPEVTALARVGDIAWRGNRKGDAQIITKRLQQVEEEANSATELDLELWGALGRAYEKLRVPERAIRAYEKILADAQEKEDREAEIAIGNTLGSLHLDWFNYPQAATAYEQLLKLARQELEESQETFYLEQLAYIYDKLAQPEQAARIREQLIDDYTQKQQLQQLTQLYLDLGSDYAAIDEAESANQNYQKAFDLAWSQQQFAYAREALQQLALLYRNYDELLYAIQIYQESLKVEQYAYDFYGQMHTYDQMGQIYRQQNDYAAALAAFEEGLELAQALGYQESYFQEQINSVRR